MNRLALIGLAILLLSCFFPRQHWPQDDLAPRTIVGTGKARVLIASRDSAHKRDLVDRIIRGLASTGVGIDVVGVQSLADTDPTGYDAVVVISNCLAWGLDAQVADFLADCSRRDRLFLMITRDGDWQADPEALGCAVITGASTPTTVETQAGSVVAWVQSHLIPATADGRAGPQTPPDTIRP